VGLKLRVGSSKRSSFASSKVKREGFESFIC
jgi:hypothetical protein